VSICKKRAAGPKKTDEGQGGTPKRQGSYRWLGAKIPHHVAKAKRKGKKLPPQHTWGKTLPSLWRGKEQRLDFLAIKAGDCRSTGAPPGPPQNLEKKKGDEFEAEKTKRGRGGKEPGIKGFYHKQSEPGKGKT